MNTEKIEGIILAEIKNCSNYSPELIKKYSSPITKLFESTFDTKRYLPKNKLEDFRYNKFSYFNSVKNTINEYLQNLSNDNIIALNESIQIFHKASDEFQLSVQNFLNDLNIVIDNISNENDLIKFDSYSRIIQKTLLFRKTPINIMGFNIFEFLNPNNIISKELKEKFNADIILDLKLLILNKSDKEIYFIFDKNKNEKTIIYYNINNNNLDFFFNKNLYEEFGISNEEFNKIIWTSENKLFENFSRFINGNILELYRNFQKFEITFEDNLYKDNTWNKYRQQIKLNSIVK